MIICLVLVASLFIVLGVKLFDHPTALGWLAPVFFVLAALTLWPLYGTWYAIFPDRLLIHCMGASRHIPLDGIERIIPIRSLRPAPALSLDRLCITYSSGGDRRELHISPMEPKRFLRELHVVAPWITIESPPT